MPLPDGLLCPALSLKALQGILSSAPFSSLALLSLVVGRVAVNLEQLVVGSFPAVMEKSPRSIPIGYGPARADTRKDVAEAADGSRCTGIIDTSNIDYGTSRLRPRHRLCRTHDLVCFTVNNIMCYYSNSQYYNVILNLIIHLVVGAEI
jgi:hypothetical protein